jgi:hypothetical protein
MRGRDGLACSACAIPPLYPLGRKELLIVDQVEGKKGALTDLILSVCGWYQ